MEALMPNPKVTPKQKVKDPVGNFGSPSDVVKDAALSVKQKKDALQEWEQDAVRLAVATEEGMAGGEPSRLAEVKDAQSELPGKPAKRPSSPTKSG
jgi:Arc/MetJ-type ribon-helix-helix transcriptional regulator